MIKSVTFVAVLSASALAVAGCGSSLSSGTTGGAQSKVLVGAGSSFVFPLVSQWTKDYSEKTGVVITYGPVGSGAGIQQITNRTVDFGASDAPLTPDQAQAAKGVLQIPWALSATSVDYNLDGAPSHLRLDGAALADIFLGTITNWNDSRIARLNPGVQLPDQQITVIHRSDGSGTTYNFTEYLSSVSSEWRSKVGTGTAVDWPAGVGGKGSSGVSAVLTRTKGGITYTDVAYALDNHFQFAAVANVSGNYVLPSLVSIQAAAQTVSSIPADNTVSIVNPPASAPKAYPICTFTYALVPEQSPKAATLKAFLTYAIGPGQKFGPPLLFAPMSEQVLQRDRETIAKIH